MDHYNPGLLRRPAGTMVTTYNDDAPASGTPRATSTGPGPRSSRLPSLETGSVATMSENSRTWVIKKKLKEKTAYLTASEVEMCRGSSRTVGKFLCYPLDNPEQTAFMRIYQQIPIIGTENDDLTTLAQQAVPPPVCGELESLRRLKNRNCSAAPRLLGHAEMTQEQGDLLPGGYVQYVVWEQVPGVPLTEELFWSFDRSARDELRSKFRAAYEEIISCGVAPGLSSISKIIFDQSTNNLHISGFRGGWPILDDLEWSETRYVEFGLAKPGKDMHWYEHPEKWEL